MHSGNLFITPFSPELEDVDSIHPTRKPIASVRPVPAGGAIAGLKFTKLEADTGL
jgi:hypothetical protein